MPVAILDNNTETLFNPATTTISYTGVTVTAGSNLGLLLNLHQSAGGSLWTATWDLIGVNQNIPIVNSITNVSSGSIQFGLVNPIPGINKTITISWTGSVPSNHVWAGTFTGMDQTGGPTSFANPASNTNSTTLVVTSATNDLVVTCYTPTLNITGVNGTQLYIDNTGSNVGGSADYYPGAASVTVGATGGWSTASAIDLVAAGGAGPQPSLMGQIWM